MSDDERQPIWARCTACGAQWATPLSWPVSPKMLFAALRQERCPDCGAGSKRLAVLTSHGADGTPHRWERRQGKRKRGKGAGE